MKIIEGWKLAAVWIGWSCGSVLYFYTAPMLGLSSSANPVREAADAAMLLAFLWFIIAREQHGGDTSGS